MGNVTSVNLKTGECVQLGLESPHHSKLMKRSSIGCGCTKMDYAMCSKCRNIRFPRTKVAQPQLQNKSNKHFGGQTKQKLSSSKMAAIHPINSNSTSEASTVTAPRPILATIPIDKKGSCFRNIRGSIIQPPKNSDAIAAATWDAYWSFDAAVGKQAEKLMAFPTRRHSIAGAADRGHFGKVKYRHRSCSLNTNATPTHAPNTPAAA